MPGPSTGLHFHAYIANSSYQILGSSLPLLQGHNFDTVALVVRPEHEVVPCSLDVSNFAKAVHKDSINIGLAAAIRLQRRVVAVNKHRRAGQQSWIHADGISLGANSDETLPIPTFPLDIRAQFAQKTAFELLNVAHFHAHDERLHGSHRALYYEDVVEFVLAGWWNAGALVDFRGVKQIEHREMLHVQHFVHGFEAQPAFTVEKIGNVSLLKADLIGQSQTRKLTIANSFEQSSAQILLQALEFHIWSIANSYTLAQSICVN